LLLTVAVDIDSHPVDLAGDLVSDIPAIASPPRSSANSSEFHEHGDDDALPCGCGITSFLRRSTQFASLKRDHCRVAYPFAVSASTMSARECARVAGSPALWARCRATTAEATHNRRRSPRQPIRDHPSASSPSGPADLIAQTRLVHHRPHACGGRDGSTAWPGA
jgi:hypothetical protein